MINIDNIIELRKILHQNPETAWNEFNTSKIIFDFFSTLHPDKTIKIGDTGLAFIFDSGKPGKRIMFRADIDALPILEINNINHKSINKGVSHVCGHDGHMAILSGFGKLLSENSPQKGAVILLFQPAEEIGEGAEMVVNCRDFKQLHPDYISDYITFPDMKRIP